MNQFIPKTDSDDKETEKMSRPELMKLLKSKGFIFDEITQIPTPELKKRVDEIRKQRLDLIHTTPSLGLIGKRGRKSLMERIDKSPWYGHLPSLPVFAEKVIFTNPENLEHLKGYKASVEVHVGKMLRYEVHIVLTDFSLKGAKDLYDKLQKMNPEEVYGDNK